MNILHLYKSAPPEEIGGVGAFIANISRGTVSAGVNHRVLVFTRNSAFRIERWECGAEIFFCPMLFQFASMPVGLVYFKQFRKLLDWADLLHLHYPFPIQDLLYLGGKLLRKMPPAIVTYHSDIVRQKKVGKLYAPLALKFLRSVDSVVATSPKYIHSSPVLKQLDTKTMIPLGISETLYPALSELRQQYFRSLYGEGFFLFLGALRYYKGLGWLVDAAIQTGLPVVIAGGGQLAAELKEQAAGAGNIHFVGQVDEDDKIALLSLAGAFVFPSHLRSEAFGISLLEAQMMHLPLITCEIGTGTSYVNDHEVTGLVVPPTDAKALGSAMQSLWDDPDMRERMGQASYERFRLLFTAKRMSESYLALYHQLMAKTV
ncbi:rhamnosyl/mannosyltransferase [Marinobacterium halophilum]|uniref:Rhamnosyl/mannosyltransferase n=1 Tax=Marinobacterium halophilum TaxID=267374 RepID=A0A2P8EXC5_9GAMM|nr:glycosyltransferase [Marinobacterium halophilum]PSL14122.1 rhamnosyl/mannosyltransferase [Marinobacterium halophilum]